MKVGDKTLKITEKTRNPCSARGRPWICWILEVDPWLQLERLMRPEPRSVRPNEHTGRGRVLGCSGMFWEAWIWMDIGRLGGYFG